MCGRKGLGLCERKDVGSDSVKERGLGLGVRPVWRTALGLCGEGL